MIMIMIHFSRQAQIKAAAAQVKTSAEQSARHKADAVDHSKQDSPPDDVRQGKVSEESLERDLSLAKVRVSAIPTFDYLIFAIVFPCYNLQIGFQLDFLTDIPVEVIRKYQERCAKINDLEKSKGSRENELATLKQKVAETKTQWLGPLSDLIERINENFARFFATMQCAGRVYLDQGTDEVGYLT